MHVIEPLAINNASTSDGESGDEWSDHHINDDHNISNESSDSEGQLTIAIGTAMHILMLLWQHVRSS